MIAIDVTPLCLGPRRGVARALQYLLQGFAQAPPDEPVKLLAPAPLPADLPTLDGVVVEPARSARAFRRALPRLLAREKADILYSPWSAFPRVGVPVVAVVHELPFVRLGPIEGRWRTWNHKRWLARNVAECAAIVVPSFATRDDLLRLSPCSGGKVHVIPWGFDPGPWEEAGRRAVRGTGSRLTVIAGLRADHGGLFKKGWDLVLEQIGFLGVDTNFAVVGRVTESQLGVDGEWSGIVRAHPDLDEPRLRELVASANLLLFPSRSEGFGFPPLEAMAAGVPVVASDAAAISEVVGDAARTFSSGDASAMAGEALDVLLNEGTATELVASGRERARQFPVARCATQVAEVLRRARGIA